MNDIVLIGPQGSGKGTQSDLLAQKLGIPHISLGTLFRTEVKNGTDIGKKIQGYISRGDIVPSDIAADVLTQRLTATDARGGVVLDGYPRTLDQADMLENILAPLGRRLTRAIYLNVPDEEAILRLEGRRVCTNTACEKNYHLKYAPPAVADVCDKCGSPLKQRDDDKPDLIKHRLSIYHTETVPLIELYRGLGVLQEINAHRNIDEVHADIVKAVGLG